MRTDMARRLALGSLAPSRGRMWLAVLGAIAGTAAYFLLSHVSWREDIPALVALVLISAYVGLLAAEQVNTLVTNRLEVATADVDDEVMRLRLRSMEERFPRRSVAYRWCVIWVAGSYFLVILVGIPSFIAALAVWGLGSAVGIDAVVLAWTRQTGVMIAASAIVGGLSSGALGFRHGLRLYRSMRTGAELEGHSPTDDRSIVALESEIGQLIPRGLRHVRGRRSRSTLAISS